MKLEMGGKKYECAQWNVSKVKFNKKIAKTIKIPVLIFEILKNDFF